MRYFFIWICLCFSANRLQAQKTLPDFSVNDVGGKIIVSWKNEYTIRATTISIQRSYDSTKNFSSIGSVLNSESKENGFIDAEPPYSRMYYRLFVAFEGGAYIITNAQKPSKDLSTLNDTSTVIYPWQLNPFKDEETVVPEPKKDNYPSSRMYTFQETNIIIDLPDVSVRKYRIIVYDDQDLKIFELKNLTESILILDKGNFPHSGWYHFEIYDGLNLIEKNRFQVPMDKKSKR